MNISVIIPTYNRVDTLKLCVEAVFNQKFDQSKYEIIIVDDGSTDSTQQYLKETLAKAPCRMECIRQNNSGPAVARNRGVAAAVGKRILFIGDDIIITPDLLDSHVNGPGSSHHAILGLVEWHKAMKITPFMKYLTGPAGKQFTFPAPGTQPGPVFPFYTANLSVDRDFLLNNGLFDERFPFASHEDIELGYRLGRLGMTFFYDPAAVAYHYHRVTIKNYCRRQFLAGHSALILDQIHPGLFPLPESNRDRRMPEPFVRTAADFADFLDSLKFPFPDSFYDRLMNYYFRAGVSRGRQTVGNIS